MGENKSLTLVVNISGDLSNQSPQEIAQKIEERLRTSGINFSETSTAFSENAVEEILNVLKKKGLSVRESLTMLKSVEKQIMLNLPISSSLNSRI